MAKVIWAADRRVTKDDGSVATSGTLTVRLADTASTVTAYTDRTLSTAQSVFNIGSDGYLEGRPTIYGDDSTGYDAYVQSTGVNGSAPWTIPDLSIAESSASEDGESASAFVNLVPNGALDVWGSTTSWSNISGDNNGVETAKGLFFAQPSAASNAVSRQAALREGAQYGIRFGRPNGSSSTNKLRLWGMLPTEAAKRCRGQTVTISFNAHKGADFSGGSLGVKIATGTGEAEDGDNIESGGFTGQATALMTAQVVDASTARFEFQAAIGASVSELGFQFSYTGAGSAGTNDWVQVEDIMIEVGAAATAFAAIPEAVAFLMEELTAGGRLLLATAFTDPNADRIFGWDDSAGAFIGFTLGTGLAFNGTAIELDADLSTFAGLAVAANNFIAGNADGTAWEVKTPIQARTAMGVTIGTDVQAYSADLATYVANPLSAAELQQLQNINANVISSAIWGYLASITAAGAALLDDADAAAQRTTLGVGADSLAVHLAGTETITGDKTFSGAATGIRAVDTNIFDFGNSTTTHALAVRFASSGTLFELTPRPSGLADNSKGLGYDFTNARWFVDTQVFGITGSNTAVAYAVGGQAGTGMYGDGAGGVRIAVNNGTAGWLFNSSGNFITPSNTTGIYLGDGTVTSPRLSFNGDQNTGWYRIGSDNVGLSLNGALAVDYSTARVLAGAGIDIRLPDTAIAPTGVYSVGYRGSPVVSGNSAYAFPAADAGSTIYHDEAGTRTWTIPANASVAHPIGTVFILDNTGNSGAAGTITLAITSDTLRRGDGISGTGSRTISAGEVAAIRKVASTIWIITGSFT